MLPITYLMFKLITNQANTLNLRKEYGIPKH